MSTSVILLFGGESSERKVSVASAQHLASHLTSPRLWFWAPNGNVYEVSKEALASHARPFELDFVPQSPATYATVAAALDACTPVETFFLALHGGTGEDGTVQALLEERRLYFTGASAEGSRAAFDKSVAKERVRAKGGKVASAEILTAANDPHAALVKLVESWKRVVVKPVADGSSTGLVFVQDDAGIKEAVALVKASPKVSYLCEPFLEGRELTVGVLDTEQGPRALPASEVLLDGGRRFDYAGKYLGLGTKEITPAEVSESVNAAIGKLAILAHQATGLLGYSRTDMIVGPDGPTFLEINNLPGLTRASFIPQQLAAANITMGDFLARQLDLARSRYMRA